MFSMFDMNIESIVSSFSLYRPDLVKYRFLWYFKSSLVTLYSIQSSCRLYKRTRDSIAEMVAPNIAIKIKKNF